MPEAPPTRRELIERVIAVTSAQLAADVRSALTATQRGVRTTHPGGAVTEAWGEIVIKLSSIRQVGEEAITEHTAEMTVAHPDLIPGLVDLLQQVELALGTGVVHQG